MSSSKTYRKLLQENITNSFPHSLHMHDAVAALKTKISTLLSNSRNSHKTIIL